MAFRDLTDVLGATPAKVLPIHGKMIEFPGRVSARAGMLLLAIQRAAQEQQAELGEILPDQVVVAAVGLDGADEAGKYLEAEMLGDSRGELDALGVVGVERDRILATLTVWHLSGQDAAEAVWEGKDPAPKASKPKAGRASKMAGGAGVRSRAAGGASSGSRSRRTT